MTEDGSQSKSITYTYTQQRYVATEANVSFTTLSPSASNELSLKKDQSWKLNYNHTGLQYKTLTFLIWLITYNDCTLIMSI